ncbi:MAG: polyprenyl synthetase family protein, partial [Actinomycetota bacterium]
MKSSLGDLRRQVDLVLKSEIRRHGAVFREWKAQGIVEELERSVFPGGKRIRPALCCLGYQAAGGRLSQKIVRAAASLELLHTFALIHDDI